MHHHCFSEKRGLSFRNRDASEEVPSVPGLLARRAAAIALHGLLLCLRVACDAVSSCPMSPSGRPTVRAAAQEVPPRADKYGEEFRRVSCRAERQDDSLESDGRVGRHFCSR